MTTQPITVYRRSLLQGIVEGCLKRVKDIWIDGVDDTSDLALVGIAGHAVKHAYIQRLIEKQIPQDQEEAHEAFVEGIGASQTPSRLIPELKRVWDFHVEYFELPLDRFVAAEEHQTEGNIAFTPDLVLAHPERNELEIVDDKWGWAPPLTEPELKGLFQARVYSRYGMERWKGFDTYRFTIHSVRFGKTASVSFTRTELDSVDIELRSAIATVEHAQQTGLWPAMAGPSCRFCELPCPIADDQRALPKRLLTAEQAQMVGAYLLADAAKDRALKAALKGFVAAHGPVSVNGVEYDNRPVEERKYPVDKVMEILTARNVLGAFEEQPGQALTLSYSSLAKLFKRFPQLEQDLAPFVQSKETYRFSARKPGEGEDE